MDAITALRIRDGLVAAWENTYRDVKGLPADEREAWELRQFKDMARLFRQASIYLWDAPIWNAATRGHEALVGSAVPEQCVDGGNELWLFDGIQPWTSPRDCYLDDPGYRLTVVAVSRHMDDATQDEYLAGRAPLASVSGRVALNWIGFWLYWHDDGLIDFGADGYPIRTFMPRFHMAEAHQFIGAPCVAEYAPVVAAIQFRQLELAACAPVPIPRPTARRRERRNEHIPAVNSVTLRRRQAESRPRGESHPRDWSCQWLVGAHWRRQWFPKAREHRPIYIEPHVKGPADKPLRSPRGSLYHVAR